MYKFATVVLLLLCGCYGPPGGPDCRTDGGTFVKGSNRCEEFQRHEDVMLTGYRQSTPQWSEEFRKSRVSGIVITVRSEVLYDKNGRAYWKDDSIKDFRIWGQTWCEEGRIDLADENLHTGVLAHEFGHVFMGCGPFDHDGMATNGVGTAITYVQQNYVALTGASGGSYSGEPIEMETPVLLTTEDGRQIIGVYERCD